MNQVNLDIINNLIEIHQKISQKEKELEILTKQLDNLMNEREIDRLLEKWEKYLENQNLKPRIEDEERVLVSISIEEHNFDVSLGVESYDIQKTYCQVEPTNGATPRSEIIEKLEEILSKTNGSNPYRYEYLGSKTYEKLYEEGCNLIEKVIKCLMEFK